MRRILRALLGLAILGSMGCELFRQVRRPASPPTPLMPGTPIRPTEIPYVDSDAFDSLFETALVNRDACIIIRTMNDKPDWTGRLNAWIAAWNMGKSGGPGRISRGQIPSIDGETLREFRLLIEGVVDRADVVAKNSVAWWREERMRSRRVELLRPYSLRFHMDDAGMIELIFFNGAYAAEHPQFLAHLTDDADGGSWSRRLECSHSKKNRDRKENTLRNLTEASDDRTDNSRISIQTVSRPTLRLEPAEPSEPPAPKR